MWHILFILFFYLWLQSVSVCQTALGWTENTFMLFWIKKHLDHSFPQLVITAKKGKKKFLAWNSALANLWTETVTQKTHHLINLGVRSYFCAFL